jgi:GNAT superfamily N-acetyltransferase
MKKKIILFRILLIDDDRTAKTEYTYDYQNHLTEMAAKEVKPDKKDDNPFRYQGEYARRIEMELIKFKDKYRQAFIDFNTDWIVSNFGSLEEHDLETFEEIDNELKNGAMIFFAVENEIPLACCMSMPMKNNTWEICKLGSNKNVQHKGAGSTVFKAAMDWALERGARRLFLISNTKLKPALHIYEKYGFKEIKLRDYEYVRGDIAFEYIVK